MDDKDPNPPGRLDGMNARADFKTLVRTVVMINNFQMIERVPLEVVMSNINFNHEKPVHRVLQGVFAERIALSSKSLDDLALN